MSKDYNKIFEYKGYQFNIKVILNTKIDKHPNGQRWHTVTINDTGPSNYYQRDEDVLDADITTAIANVIKHAQDFVDKKNQLTETETTLINLGFV